MNTQELIAANNLNYLIEARDGFQDQIVNHRIEIDRLRQHNPYYPVRKQHGLIRSIRAKLKNIDIAIADTPHGPWIIREDLDEQLLQLQWKQWKDNKHIKKTQRASKQRLILRQNQAERWAIPLC